MTTNWRLWREGLLSLTERSVESHKYRIMRKLHIHDRVALTMFAIREGFVVPH